MKTLVRSVVVACVCVPALRAQDVAARGSVRGQVYDSVAGRPLAGALVQMVAARDPSAAVYNATSDAAGRYALSSVAPGEYVIGFHDPALDLLGLESPLRAVVVRGADTVVTDLAIPAAATIGRAVCGASGVADSTGMIIGVVRDARRGDLIADAVVEASWNELTIDATGLSQRTRTSRGRSNTNGWFALCAVPANIEVAMAASRGADSTGIVPVTAPYASLVRQDLEIGGVATLRGTVINERMRPIANARVSVVGRDRVAVTDSLGAFRLGDIPSGSQSLETRAIGHAPDHRTFVLRPDADSAVAIRLTTMRRVLDTIQVSAQRLFDRDSRGFQQRRRFGNGQFFDENDIRRRRPFDMLQLLQQVPSIRVSQSGFERAVYMRGTIGMCKPVLFVDGMRMTEDDAADIDLFARPDEVAGVEIYRSGQVPAQFHVFNGCGAIVVWTKPRIRR